MKVLYAYCETGDLTNAERVLNKMEDLANSSDSSEIIPESKHYAKLIETFVMSADSTLVTKNVDILQGAPQRAQAILEHMEEMYSNTLSSQPQEKWKDAVKPDVECYNNVMKIWSASKEPMSASKVQKVYHKVTSRKSYDDSLPNMETFEIMIDTWCSSKQHSAIFKVTAVLRQMDEYVQKHKLNIVERQEEDEDVNIDPDEDTHAEIVNADTCYPTLKTYKSVLQFLAASKQRESAYIAHGILKKIDQNFQAKASNVKPDLDCYRLVFLAWSKSKSKRAAPRSEKLLSWMEENHMRPDQLCFAYVIHTLASSPFLENAAERSDAALVRMENVYHTVDNNVKPTWKQYFDVISAWANDETTKNSTEEAIKVLNRMETITDVDTDGLLIATNSKVFIATMKAFLHPHADPLTKSKQVFMLHERMLDEHLSGNEEAKPNVESFNIILQVCSKITPEVDARTKLEAFGIASKAFQDLRDAPDYGSANNITYRRILECCSNLLPPGKKQIEAIERIFQHSCRDGLVDETIHDHIRQWIPLSNYKRMIVQHIDKKKHTLPASWSKSLKRKTILYSKSVGGKNTAEAGMKAHMMRGLREKTNQNILRGGRI